MTDLSRRTMLAGTAALAAAPLGTMKTEAAMPQGGKQAAGWYRYKVGDVEVTVVTDGANRLKFPDNFVVNKTRDDVNAALAAAFMEKDVFVGPYNPIVVNSGGKLYLIDTGTGEAAFNSSKGANGQLLNNLAVAGIDPKSIDAVIISHHHGDHINGLLKADGSLAFANAEILVPETEHKYWMDDGEMSRAPNERIAGIFKNARRVFSGEAAKRTKPYAWDKEVVPGITAVGTPGHSPGHTSHVISSGSSKLFVQGDVTHAPYLFVRNPDWHPFYDHDPKMAEATRRKVYDMLVAERMMVQGFHYPFPSHAYVEKAGNGYREVMVPWNPTI